MSKITSENCLAVIDRNIKPYRTINLWDGTTIIEFWRVEQDQTSSVKNTPTTRGANKEMAMLSFDKERANFTIHYYPLDKSNLIVKTCPIKDLQMAINDLKMAGF